MKKPHAVLLVLACLSMVFVASAEEPTSAGEVAETTVSDEGHAVDEEILELLDPSQGVQRSVAEFPKCGETPFSTPCDECPEACTMNGDVHPCGCESFGGFIGDRCLCPL